MSISPHILSETDEFLFKVEGDSYNQFLQTINQPNDDFYNDKMNLSNSFDLFNVCISRPLSLDLPPLFPNKIPLYDTSPSQSLHTNMHDMTSLQLSLPEYTFNHQASGDMCLEGLPPLTSLELPTPNEDWMHFKYNNTTTIETNTENESTETNDISSTCCDKTMNEMKDIQNKAQLKDNETANGLNNAFDMNLINVLPSDKPEMENPKQVMEEDEKSESYSSKSKSNHTWEETACHLQLNMTIPEMSSYSIPNKWLMAEEYYKLLDDMENKLNCFPYYDLGYDHNRVTYHPPFIYYNPCPAIYFLRCEHLKNGKPIFGFPRIKNVSKAYTWKKQGFTTVVPKSQPCIRYVTANCYVCGKGKNKNNMFAAFSGREPVLRMHAVMKIKSYETRGDTAKYQNDNYIDKGPYVLIHILKGGVHS